MYEWHAAHPDKGKRFTQAMKGVAKCRLEKVVAVEHYRHFANIRQWHSLTSIALDPADSLLRKHIGFGKSSHHTKVIEIGGRYGFASVSLVEERPDLSFEVRCESQEFLRRGEALVSPQCKSRISFTNVKSLFEPVPSGDSDNVLVYVIRNLLWNWTDEDIVKLLRTLLPMAHTPQPVRVLIADGVSPTSTQFPPHVELAYRRRDITTMTMHNVKQRTQEEWMNLFLLANSALKVSCS